MTSDVVDDFIVRREAARAQGLPMPVLAQATTYNAGGSGIVSVRSEARLGDGTVFAREAVAVMRPTPLRPVSYVAWRESTAAPTEGEAAGASDASAGAGK